MSERQTAVALSYLEGRDPAPRVVARGRGDLARRILDLARRHGIAVRRDGDLAEALARVQTGRTIPPELYRAVAEVLAFLYRVDRLYP